jgi:pimeloyl-ACP methyl ester carboxylesterase
METATYVTGPAGPLLGIVTRPADPVGNVIICPGGWHSGSTNGNRLAVRLARTAAGAGRVAVRFDWHGTGESPGSTDLFRLDEPFAGDVVAAAGLLPDPDLPLGLFGTCFGARTALVAAADLPGLDALLLVSFPFPAGRAKATRTDRVGTTAALRRAIDPAMIRGWRDPATRRVYVKFLRRRVDSLMGRLRRSSGSAAAANLERRRRSEAILIEELAARLDVLVDHGVRVLFVFGEGDAHRERFDLARRGRLGPVIDRAGGAIDSRVLPGDLTGLSSLEAQDSIIDVFSEWLSAG